MINETTTLVPGAVQATEQAGEAGTDWVVGTSEAGMRLAVEYGPQVLIALAMLVGGWWLVGLATRMVGKVLRARKVEDTLVGFLVSIAKALLMTIVIVSVLGALGIPTTSLAAVIAAGGLAIGLAIGLALQGTLSNFASGVMLIFFKPFRAGDLVEVAGQLGVVEEVQIFVTSMVTLDNRLVLIPNGAIMAGNIMNYSGKDTRRVDMVFGISYGDDIKHAKQVMEQVLANNSLVLQDPSFRVAVSELADSSVNFVVRPWCKTEDYWDVWFSVTEDIKLALDAASITIPFPQRDVHMENVA